MAQDKDEKDTIERVMHAFKEGELKSGGGKPVRKREQAIAIALSEAREYLATRYGPELGSSWTQLNRLLATLDEVAAKVTAAMAQGS